MRDRILETAFRSFSTFGVKSITMQDIARECGISKKTVYEHFADKTELVDEVIAYMLRNHTQGLDESTASAGDAIDEQIRSLKQTERLVRSVNPVLLYELEKYHPSAWKSILAFKDQVVRPRIKANLDRGIGEGLFRADLHKDIMTHMRMLQLEAPFNPLLFPAASFDLHEVLCQITQHFICGIATPEGHRRIAEYQAAKQTA
ncbi:TetR/AcrR family transcriptional regulator [Chitinophaga lutea]